jgi:hypothetical protein
LIVTKEEIDTMWQQAMRQSIEEDEMFTRYHFAKLVAAKAFQNGYEKGIAAFNDAVLLEREACAKVCEQSAQNYYPVIPEASGACTHLATAIRARGQA